MSLRRARGFTLLEILLVMVILGMSAMFVTIAVPNQNAKAEQTEALRLGMLVEILSDDAIRRGEDYGIYFDQSAQPMSYRFLILTADGWQPLEHRLAEKVTMEKGMAMSVTVDGFAWQQKDSLFEGDDSLFEPSRFEQDEDKIEPPQVLILSSGEVTPFEADWLEQGKEESQRWFLRVNELGKGDCWQGAEHAPQ
ncbi:Type II secretion system protein H [Vibrio stylophorae]|uniref:Type II secretion system protein H n=1 Tax=Vibrio stylophorae TaxID=659351 RepID=A0ABM8ZR07_9VIBR|nr:type II secretion system minor pseudopilin GspH [Vibrio stylophorae]CAH0532340.1 Type II secretion system protein H [Vibrio stylophorae]